MGRNLLNLHIMLVKTYGYAVQGISATKITIEVNVGTGSQFLSC